MSLEAADDRIRRLRPARPKVAANRPHGSFLERERRPDGTIEQALTVFLTGAECPFACSFCDLWQWTIDGPTPPGALSAQLKQVLALHQAASVDRVKLYNASNFFDRRAVPIADVEGIAAQLTDFPSVTVESHAATIGHRAVDFSRLIHGRLEVALGLESIHPRAMAESNKRLDLPRFEHAVTLLKEHDIDVRVFVLLGLPYVPPAETVDWTVRSVEYAARIGADVVSIIPVRSGNGELERLRDLGFFTPPTLRQLEESLMSAIDQRRTVVTADLWDVSLLPGCEQCRDARVERMRAANLSGIFGAAVLCPACDPS